MAYNIGHNIEVEPIYTRMSLLHKVLIFSAIALLFLNKGKKSK